MSKRDALDIARYLKSLHNRIGLERDDIIDVPRHRKQRESLSREMDRIAALNAMMLKEYRRETKPRKDPEIKVGDCPCGLPIMISDRYSLNVKGPTTINRKCQGYRCGRVNAVIINASYTVQRATWKTFECRCGGDIYLRSDYTGGAGFSGYDAEGKTRFDTMVVHQEDRKNRTVKIGCPRCDCKYKLKLRFTTDENGTCHRNIGDGSTVARCKGCQNRPER